MPFKLRKPVHRTGAYWHLSGYLPLYYQKAELDKSIGSELSQEGRKLAVPGKMEIIFILGPFHEVLCFVIEILKKQVNP